MFPAVPSYPVHRAAALGDLPRVQALLQGGADPNFEDGEGRTPLHHAAAHGQMEAAKMLLRAGARREQKDRQGSTPLMLAKQAGHRQMAALLEGKPEAKTHPPAPAAQPAPPPTNQDWVPPKPPARTAALRVAGFLLFLVSVGVGGIYTGWYLATRVVPHQRFPLQNPGKLVQKALVAKTCNDFDTQEDAQTWFDTHQESSTDRRRMDEDGNGKPCETLPTRETLDTAAEEDLSPSAPGGGG